MENQIVGRLYYNRNKSHSFNNLGVPHSTKNKNNFSLSRKFVIKEKDEEINKTKNNELEDMTTTQANNIRKNLDANNIRYELNDFNAFLEKLSNYENKKGLRK